MHTTVVGRPVHELDTPALLLDLDAFEANVAAMAADIASRGAAWRPHAKAHKCPAIAHRQLEAGAIGITVAKVGEAEVFAASGVRDILIANQIVGPIKTRRLAALAHHADVAVLVDNPENVRELDAAARDAGSCPRVLIEIETGMQRAGVLPDRALELAKQIAACRSLRFAGVQTWEGHTVGMAESPERQQKILDACRALVETAEAIRSAGIPVEIVSGGGTGTYLTSSGVTGVTEVEAGGGIFGDLWYHGFKANVQSALAVLTQVTSRPTPTRVICDAGRKSIDPTTQAPQIRGLSIEGNIRLSAEHATISLPEASDTPRIGERLEYLIGYSDQCTHLHEAFYGIRNGMVETVWPITARGRLQ
jgi:D-serine deaminase-like pyridoxal phosphate-dependent protein